MRIFPLTTDDPNVLRIGVDNTLKDSLVRLVTPRDDRNVCVRCDTQSIYRRKKPAANDLRHLQKAILNVASSEEDRDWFPRTGSTMT